MAKKIVTLYVDDTSIRVLVTQGKRIKKWADMPLDPGLVKNAVVVNEIEVANKLKELFRTRKIRAKKVVVGISGLHCLTRAATLPQLPKAMLDEAVRREARRVLPVPPEQLYISWQTIPGPEGKIQVFMVALPCKTADGLLKTLHQAGLKPYLMDTKPMILTRVVKDSIAVIVDVQPTEFDIVITVNGVPQPIRTVALTGEVLSWQDKLPLIRDELDRTIKFYNSNNAEKPLAPNVPIFASGDLANEPQLHQTLANELGHPVMPLPYPAFEYPGGLDPNHYLVNVGLALKKMAEEDGLAIDLNVLPAPYRPKPLSLTTVVAMPTAVVAFGLLVPVVMLIQGASADIASACNQLDSTSKLIQQSLTQRQELTQKIAQLEKKFAEAEKSSRNLTTILANLDKQGEGVNGDLEVMMKYLPGGITLTNVSLTNGVLTINGKTTSENEVLSYLKNLDATGRFSEIIFSHFGKTGAEKLDFTLILKGGKRS